MKAVKGSLLIVMAAAFWGISGMAEKFLFVGEVDPPIILNELFFLVQIIGAVLVLVAVELLQIRWDDLLLSVSTQ